MIQVATPTIMPHPVLSTYSLESIGTVISSMNLAGQLGNPQLAAWPVVNLAIFIPIVIKEYRTITKVWWRNGAVNGNVDFGLYRPNGDGLNLTRLFSTGSVAQSNAGAADNVQVVDVADYSPIPGLHYMGLVLDNNVGQIRKAIAGSTAFLALFGMGQMAAAFPLPPAVALATLASDMIPEIGLLFDRTVL